MESDHDECRFQFTISIEVNGLKESSLRACLMMEEKLKQNTLALRLKARRTANESEAILGRSRSLASVMQEPTTSADVHRVERLIVEVRIREYVEYVETKIKDMFDKKVWND